MTFNANKLHNSEINEQNTNLKLPHSDTHKYGEEGNDTK